MFDLRAAGVVLAALALTACEGAGTAVKQTADDFAKEAAQTASGMVGVKTACTIAGQSEAFCGCIDERLGSKLDAGQLEALSKVVVETVRTGSIEAAARNAEALNPETRQALAQCAARAAVTGAVGAAAQ
ncbi:MAG: hypothetical protein JNK30_04215 [Phenylobacterium sp.]|uniref:hypothetical protein n=1 Tax=Phenylobacterium sp. TaxID=1871053 RepID=UPI001A42A94D|nr:hypothetical protein [Phenylobacterium sp.]MBL8770564.1 hypothetical protein [Phenylobacterium sp.]